MDHIKTNMFEIGNESLSMKIFRQAARYVSWKRRGGVNTCSDFIGVGLVTSILNGLLVRILDYAETFLGNYKFFLFIPWILFDIIALGRLLNIKKNIIERAKNPDIKTRMFAFPGFKKTLKAWVLMFIVSSFTSLGIGLLVIPGIIVGVRLFFSLHILLDTDCSIRDAITYSWKITKGHFRKFIWFQIYFGFFSTILMILGVILAYIIIPLISGILAMKFGDLSFVVAVIGGIITIFLSISGIRTIPMQQIALVYYYYQISQLYDKNTNPQTHQTVPQSFPQGEKAINTPIQTVTSGSVNSLFPEPTFSESPFLGEMQNRVTNNHPQNVVQPTIVTQENNIQKTGMNGLEKFIIFLIIAVVIGMGYFFLKGKFNLSEIIEEVFEKNNKTAFINNQGLARDTARQVALSQFQTAIITYKALTGKYPTQEVTHTDTLTELGEKEILSELPEDPLNQTYPNVFKDITLEGDFLYIPVKYNGKEAQEIILAAKMETPQKANYVSTEANKLDINEDYENIIPCSDITLDPQRVSTPAIKNTKEGENHCIATSQDQLWFLKISEPLHIREENDEIEDTDTEEVKETEEKSERELRSKNTEG